VADYLEWFQDAYVFFTVRLFDASLARSNTNPKKIYSIDHALVRSVSSGVLINSGHLLENLVFAALRRVEPEIFYYKTKSGREVDFLTARRGASRRLVQVCESLAMPETRQREITALGEAMVELKLTQSCIVTRSEEDRIELDSGVIEVVPAWRFLLNLPDGI
jgi:predicted AAA+ superfamily ATPase